ncbi:MAG: histidine phosphatase family protein [Ruminococcaceae bacterium]|nr:histidine phosphatase family protein [Oscillospiraceae bacterium]
MTKIYIVRHCEAIGNVKRLFQGTSDYDISEMGAKQLEFLTERFENIQLERVYTSPLIRTVKTAKAVVGKRNIEIVPYKGLIEIDGGFLEGRPFDETFLQYPDLADKWNNAPHEFAPKNGEPMKLAYERIWNTVLSLAKENAGKTIAAATHGGVIRCLACRLIKGNIEQLKEVGWSDNTAVALIEFDDDFNARLVYYNDHSHLPDGYLPKRSNISDFTKQVSK